MNLRDLIYSQQSQPLQQLQHSVPSRIEVEPISAGRAINSDAKPTTQFQSEDDSVSLQFESEDFGKM
jgi:hypothetical protein